MDLVLAPERSSEDLWQRIWGYLQQARKPTFLCQNDFGFDLGGKFFPVPTKSSLTFKKGGRYYTAAAIFKVFAFGECKLLW